MDGPCRPTISCAVLHGVMDRTFLVPKYRSWTDGNKPGRICTTRKNCRLAFDYLCPVSLVVETLAARQKFAFLSFRRTYLTPGTVMEMNAFPNSWVNAQTTRLSVDTILVEGLAVVSTNRRENSRPFWRPDMCTNPVVFNHGVLSVLNGYGQLSQSKAIEKPDHVIFWHTTAAFHRNTTVSLRGLK